MAPPLHKDAPSSWGGGRVQPEEQDLSLLEERPVLLRSLCISAEEGSAVGTEASPWGSSEAGMGLHDLRYKLFQICSHEPGSWSSNRHVTDETQARGAVCASSGQLCAERRTDPVPPDLSGCAWVPVVKGLHLKGRCQ